MKLIATRGGIQIDDGMYAAILKQVEVKDPTPNSPRQVQFLSWVFSVDDGSFELPEMRQATSMNFGPKSNARKWAEAIMGRPLEIGESIDLDTFTNLACRVLVKNDVESGFARITEVMGAPKKSQKSAPPAAVEV